MIIDILVFFLLLFCVVYVHTITLAKQQSISFTPMSTSVKNDTMQIFQRLSEHFKKHEMTTKQNIEHLITPLFHKYPYIDSIIFIIQSPRFLNVKFIRTRKGNVDSSLFPIDEKYYQENFHEWYSPHMDNPVWSNPYYTDRNGLPGFIIHYNGKITNSRDRQDIAMINISLKSYLINKD